MDLENHIHPSLSFEESQSRVQSPLRMKYSAEVQLIKNQFGKLEDIRKTLGLSQRKICQLLLVDPSAWSRWTKSTDGEAPPHIYRALSWFLILQEKNPEVSPFYFLQTVARPQVSAHEVKKISAQVHEDIFHQFKVELTSLSDRNQQLKRWIWIQALVTTGLFILLVLVMSRGGL